jgi:hypothetical protein
MHCCAGGKFIRVVESGKRQDLNQKLSATGLSWGTESAKTLWWEYSSHS